MFHADDAGQVFFSRRMRGKRGDARSAAERSSDVCVKLGVKKGWAEGSYLLALGGVVGFLVTAFDPERSIHDPLVILLGLVATLPPLVLLPWRRRQRADTSWKAQGLRQLPLLNMMQTGHIFMLLVAVIIWTVRAWRDVIALIGG